MKKYYKPRATLSAEELARQKAIGRARYWRLREKILADRKAYYWRTRPARLEERCRSHWKRRGVDLSTILPQSPCCDNCGRTGRLHMDHDHATGRCRGWLCICCNRALGLLRDNPAIIRGLAAYLEREQ